MRKQIAVSVVLIFYLISVRAQVTFTGTAYHSPEQKVWLTNSFGKKIDSAVITSKTPKFILTTNINKETLIFIRYEKKSPYILNEFVVTPGEKVFFSFDVQHENPYQWIDVGGSSFTSERMAFYKKILPYKIKIEKVSKKINSIQKNNSSDTDAVKSLIKQIDTDQSQIDIIAKKTLDTTHSALNAGMIYTMLKHSFASGNVVKDSVLIALKSHFPYNVNIQSFTNVTSAEEGLMVHRIVPDIVLKDMNGLVVDYRNINCNYLLIDFWASWCQPCREESPYLLKTFKKFKDKGFQILSVSIDADLNSWKKAIHADGISEFINLVDTTAAKSVYLKEYKVSGLPANFLIDKNGNIVAKNLRGDDLYKEVSKLMSTN